MKQKGTFPKQMKQKRKMKMLKNKMGTFPKKMNVKRQKMENCAVTMLLLKVPRSVLHLVTYPSCLLLDV
jgi:hypothetical protein